MQTWLFSLEEELGASLSLGMAAVLIMGAPVFTVSITSGLPCGSFNLVAQILHLTGAGFLASSTGLGAFRVQILDTDKHEASLWAPGPWLDWWRTLPGTLGLQLVWCGTLLRNPDPWLTCLGR
ncbi:hypothetical protein H920_11480 [Fukomys damarensis]|uniref:Uncharacterized protein n=1 Tax=Fukomys damarensis TaxID=885580 RepID=A0A091D9Y8_FUKDA|nr:hypothetical protein H920_11480 [Fukomys damarensis]